MRRYLMVACGLVIFGAAYLAAQGGGEQKGAPPEARLRETVAKLRAGRIATPTDYDRLNDEQKASVASIPCSSSILITFSARAFSKAALKTSASTA